MNGGFILLGHQMSSRSKLIQDEYHLESGNSISWASAPSSHDLTPPHTCSDSIIFPICCDPATSPQSLVQLEVIGVVGKIHWRTSRSWLLKCTSNAFNHPSKDSRRKRRLLLTRMRMSQSLLLSVIWIPILVTLVYGQGVNLNQDEGSPCFVRDKDGIDDLSQPQVRGLKF